MANVDRPFGLIPIGHLDGSKWNGMTQPFLFDDTNACYVGDPVKSAGSAGAAGLFVNGQPCEGMPTATVAAAGDTLLGVVVAFLPLQSDLTLLYKAATAADRIGLVCTSPDVVYEVQEDSVGGAIAVTAVGNNADIAYTAGNATTGISAVELDSSGVGTATAQLRILRMVSSPDNELGVNARWRVAINEHEHKTTTGT